MSKEESLVNTNVNTATRNSPLLDDSITLAKKNSLPNVFTTPGISNQVPNAATIPKNDDTPTCNPSHLGSDLGDFVEGQHLH